MRDEVKMDANRLIAEVYKRPALWNQRHISYHNREVTNRVWMEIATIFKLPRMYTAASLYQKNPPPPPPLDLKSNDANKYRKFPAVNSHDMC